MGRGADQIKWPIHLEVKYFKGLCFCTGFNLRYSSNACNSNILSDYFSVLIFWNLNCCIFL